MKKYFKKIIKLILIAILCVLPIFTVLNVKADSGWDSSYDSGSSHSSSSSSSSSYSSSSSHSSSSSSYNGSSYDSDSSGNTISGKDFAKIVILFLIADASFTVCGLLIFAFVIMYIKRKNKEIFVSSEERDLLIAKNYKDISEDKLKKVTDIPLVTLKEEVFDKFVAIQESWMNFDYDRLRDLCTDELFNSYEDQLKTLKLKNGQNIMSDFDNLNTKIINAQKQNGTITITAFVHTTFFDYVINTNNNEVIRGTKDRKINNNYIMKFVMSSDKPVDECPSCGAKITDKASTVCEYCGSTIVKSSQELVLSSKQNINK